MDCGDEKAGSHIRFFTGPNCVQYFAQVDTSADDEDHGDRDDDQAPAGSRDIPGSRDFFKIPIPGFSKI